MSKLLLDYCRTLVRKYGLYGACYLPVVDNDLRIQGVKIEKLFSSINECVGFSVVLFNITRINGKQLAYFRTRVHSYFYT